MSFDTQSEDFSHERLLGLATEEFLDSQERGESVSVDEFASKYPDIAPLLRSLLPSLALLNNPHPRSAKSSSHSARPERAPASLGDYRLLREIGRGGMGVVYEAQQLSIERRVAVKILSSTSLVDETTLRRFRNEVRAAASLEHPNIVAIYSVGEETGYHYYAMQLIRGQTLAEVIDERRSAVTRHSESSVGARTPMIAEQTLADRPRPSSGDYFRFVARLGIQAANALDHAHRNGVLHRDVKPANLLLDEGDQLWITDFGLARLDVDPGVTRTGGIVGTLRYSSPEQLDPCRMAVDQRTDIYSLGLSLYELATLQPAYPEGDPKQLLRQIENVDPIRPRQLSPTMPFDLEVIVSKAIEKDATDRYLTARDLANDLDSFLHGRPIVARPMSRAGHANRWIKRNRRWAASIAAALAVSTLVLAACLVLVGRSRQVALQALAASTESERRLNDAAYTTNMALAYQYWDQSWSEEVDAILNRYDTRGKTEHATGYEWALLKSLNRKPTAHVLGTHDGPANELAVFPNRPWCASVGSDGTVRIWDIESRKPLGLIALSGESLHSVAVSPDGTTIAAGSNRLFLIDVASKRVFLNVVVSDYTIESLEFAPDGQSVAAGVRYDEICVINRSGQVLHRRPWASRVESMAYVPSDNELLAPAKHFSNEPESYSLARLSSSLEPLDSFQWSVEGEGCSPTAVRYSEQAQLVAVAERYGARISVLDFPEGRRLANSETYRAYINDVAISPSGKLFAAAYENGRVQLFKFVTRTRTPRTLGVRLPSWFDYHIATIDAHRSAVSSVKFLSKDRLITCGVDGLIKLWDTSERTIFYDTDTSECDLALSANGAYAAMSARNELVIYDVAREEVAFRQPHDEAFAVSSAWSPQADCLAYCSSPQRKLRLMQVDGTVNWELPVSGQVNSITFSPGGRRVAIAFGNTLQIHDSKSGNVLASSTLPGTIYAVKYSPDGSTIVCGGGFNSLEWLNAKELTSIATLAHDLSQVTYLAYHPNGRLLAAGHEDGDVSMWDVSGKNQKWRIPIHSRTVRSIKFGPDGSSMLTSSSDGTLRVAAAETGRVFGVLERQTAGPIGELDRCDLSDDGKTLAIGYRRATDQPEFIIRKIEYDVAKRTSRKDTSN